MGAALMSLTIGRAQRPSGVLRVPTAGRSAVNHIRLGVCLLAPKHTVAGALLR